MERKKKDRLLVEEMDTTDIKKLERRIVRIYEDRYFSNDLLVEERAKECIDSLLNQRWHMMHSSIVWDDDFIARLSAMNEKMKQAVLEMRRLTLDTFEHLMASCPKDKEIETTGTLWVDDMDMEGWKHGSHMWGYLSEILQTPELGWANLYKYGVTREVVYCSDETSWHTNADNTELEVLYQMSGQLDNWNEFMDREKTDHLNIIYGVHNMIDHCGWTLQDLINIKSYKIQVKVEYMDKKKSK